MNKTGYVIFHENGKAGLKNAQGHVVLSAEYDKILDYDDDGYIRVLKENIYGTVDLDGKEVILHSLGLTHLGVFHQHTARAMKNGRWGLVDEKGCPVGTFNYALMGAHRKWGYSVTTLDGQQGVVDEKGNFTPSQTKAPAHTTTSKPLYSNEYDYPPSFYKGFAVCHKQGKYGILKHDGAYLFPMVYATINWNDFKKEDCWFAEDDRACYLLYPDGSKKIYLKSQAERAPLGIGKIPDKEIDKNITEEQLEWVLAEPKDILALHPKIPVADKFFDSLREWTGRTFNPLNFYYRDTDAPIDVDKIYKKGKIIRCGSEMEVTQKLLRPVHKLRFIVASPRLFKTDDYPTRNRKELEESPFEEYVIGRNLFFIVMDVFHYADMTQVLLLQLPHDAVVYAQKQHIKMKPQSLEAVGPDDEPLVSFARHDLQIKAAEPVHGFSLSDKWVKKMWQPIGLDKNLAPVSIRPDKTPWDIDSDNLEKKFICFANDENGYWSKAGCQEVAKNTIKVKLGDVNHFQKNIVVDIDKKSDVKASMKVAEEDNWDTVVFNCKNNSSLSDKKVTEAKNVVDVVMSHLLTQQYKGDVVFCCESKKCAEVYCNELEEGKRNGELSE